MHLSTDYEVYDSSGNASIRISPSDFMVRLKTFNNEDSKAWFGDVDISFNAECAEQIAKAMLKVAQELKTEGIK